MRLRTLLLLALAAFLPVPLSAQSGDLQTKLEEKLHEPFVAKGGWITNFDDAKKAARADADAGGNGLIFIYFSRSYAP